MKHYFKWSVHIIIGLIIIVIALLLWRESAWAPQTAHDIQPTKTAAPAGY